jgi:hypothetical protein
VPHANRFLPAAAWYLRFYLYFVFALCERKNEIQKKIKYRSAEGWIADCVSPVIKRSDRMAVIPATLTPLKNGSPDKSRQVIAQFNPQSLKLGFRARASTPPGSRLTDSGSTGSSAATAKQVTVFTASLTALEFLFDTTDTNEDVRKTTLKIIGMLQVPGTNDSPLVQFQWGSFIFNGTINSVDETIDYFSDAGVPLRATVTLSMENNEPKLESPASTAGAAGAGVGFSAGISGGVSAGFSAGISDGVSAGFSAGISAGASVGTTPLTIAPQGASIQSLSINAGMDWKAVAAANNIDNPRAVQPGTVLNLNVGAKANLSSS